MSEIADPQARFIELAASANFGDRYYEYCARFRDVGPEFPLETQIDVLKETGRTFRYHKSEKFFAWRDSNAPEGCELGLNLILRFAKLHWIIVFDTPTVKLGGPMNTVAFQAKRYEHPSFLPDPPNPMARAASKGVLARATQDGLSLYDSLAAQIAKTKWT